MSKKVLTISAALLIASSAFAIPAKRIKRQVQQPDGTTLTIMTRGDENFHFTSTEDGEPLVKASDGSYRYAVLDASGKLSASSQVAHDKGSRTPGEIAFLATYGDESLRVRSLGAKRAAQSNARRLARLAKNGAVDASGRPRRQQMAGATGGEGIGVTGKRKGLVILVNFKDKKMQSKHTREEWDDLFNKEGYNKLGNNGSVHDYFYEQSYGKFDLEFDVFGPVTVSKNMAAYGANASNGDDIDPAGMVVEACKLAYDQNKMDMSQYDWDGDGAVDQVYLVYAGYSEAADGGDDCIWPHEWDIQDAGYSLVLGGQRIRTYGCSSELDGNAGTNMTGIGTPCHEFSHCMGIPDMYDVDYSGGYGMSQWDLMDYGSYGGDGYVPAGYNTYEKWVSGWIDPTILKEPTFVKDMKPLSEAPEACVVFNDATSNEYYIFENRQLRGSDKALPAHGMLVIHVDYDKDVWVKNAVNDDPSHQHFTVVPADNKLSTLTDDDDTYPGTTGSTELTDTSKPAAKLFNANSDGRKFLGKPLTDIKEKDGLISFTFMGGISIDAPEPYVKDMDATSFTAAWNSVENAETYNLELREKSAQPSADESLLLGEDLSTWGSKLTADGTKDISSELDSRMKNAGWTGEKVFECPGCAKLGSAKQAGYLASPLITDHSSASVTVRVASSAYGTDAASSVVSLVDAAGNTISEQTITPNGQTQTVVLANANESDYSVKLAPKKRGYVYSISIYDGEYADEDFNSLRVAPKSVMKAAAQRFTDVTATEYSFSNLTAGAQYQWRVQAVGSGVQSAWSAWQTVDMSAYTGIAASTVKSALSGDDIVDVCTSAGVSLGRMTYSQFLAMPLAQGVYVVRAAGSVIKVAR